MNDHNLWLNAVLQSKRLHDSMKYRIKNHYTILLEQIMHCKLNIMEQVTSSGSVEICKNCGGKCCLYGKYHVTLIEIMTYHHTGKTIPTPDFSNHPYCPYSNNCGCMMPLAMRPTTCVIFNCEELENVFSNNVIDTIRLLESELRQTISKLNTITATRMDRPLLIWSTEQNVPNISGKTT